MPDSAPVTEASWLARHPFLKAVAEFRSQVESALEGLTPERPAVPAWSDYHDEFLQGIPVFGSARVTVDLEPAGRMVAALVERMGSRPLPRAVAEDLAALRSELREGGVTPGRLAAWLTGDDPFTPTRAGLLRNVGWRAAALSLAPVARAFDAWRDEERWMRRYCPLCGSPPVMAQLAGTDPGRRRYLSCGRCGTRWRYRRTACPFCEHDAQRLASLTLDGESGLRIDWCEACRGYLKTYDGEGNERVLLSDWSSLHLDVIALDRGWIRAAASLYEITASPGVVS